MNERSEKYFHGSCLCGAIQFQVRNIGERMGHCHCSMCRKFHGAAFATYGESKQSDFQWIKGESYLKSYRANNGTTRQFCKTCGSSLTFASDNYDKNVVEFSMAALDDEVTVRPDAHIYTGYKASWYNIVDDLPQHREGRNSEEKSKL